MCWTGVSHSFYLDYLYYIYIFLILSCKAQVATFFIVIKQIVYVFLVFICKAGERPLFWYFSNPLSVSSCFVVLEVKQLFWIYRLNLFGTKLTILENGKSWYKVDHHLVIGWVDLCKRVHNFKLCKDKKLSPAGFIWTIYYPVFLSYFQLYSWKVIFVC